MKPLYIIGSVAVLGLGIFLISKDKNVSAVAGASDAADVKSIGEAAPANLGVTDNTLNHAKAAGKTEASTKSIANADNTRPVYSDPAISEKMTQLRLLSDKAKTRRQNAPSRSEILERSKLNHVIARKISPYLEREGMTEDKIREISVIFAKESERTSGDFKKASDPLWDSNITNTREDTRKQLIALVGEDMAERVALIYNSTVYRDKLAIPAAIKSNENGAPLSTEALVELGIVLYKSNVSLALKTSSPKTVSQAQYESRTMNDAEAIANASKFLSQVQIQSVEKVLRERYVVSGN